MSNSALFPPISSVDKNRKPQLTSAKNVKNADWYASNVVAKFVPLPGLADTEFAVGNVMLLSVVVKVNNAGPLLPVAPQLRESLRLQSS